jgi:hypothetical protein
LTSEEEKKSFFLFTEIIYSYSPYVHNEGIETFVYICQFWTNKSESLFVPYIGQNSLKHLTALSLYSIYIYIYLFIITFIYIRMDVLCSNLLLYLEEKKSEARFLVPDWGI